MLLDGGRLERMAQPVVRVLALCVPLLCCNPPAAVLQGVPGDAGVDGGPDAGPDAGIDAGSDAGPDAGADAGFGCVISGGFYPSRANNPLDRTQCCNPIANPMGWTNRFSEGSSYDLVQPGGGSESVARDLNGDGIIDVAICGDNWVRVYLGQPNGSFSSAILKQTAHTCSGMTSGSLEGSGKIDLILAYNDIGKVGVLLNLGDGHFGGEIDFDTEGAVARVAAGDLNGDGWPDVAYGQFDGEVGVLFNLGLGDGRLGNGVVLSTFGGVGQVHTGDFNGDGILDVAATVSSPSGGLAIFINDGGGSFGAPAINSAVPVSQNQYGDAFAVGKFVAGVFDDLAVADVDTIVLGENLAAASWTSSCSVGVLMVADVDRDGNLDIVRAGGSTLGVSYGKGDGTFSPESAIDLGIVVQTIDAADLNSDGAPDIAVIPFGGSSWTAWYNGCP
jgi:hypothetical protein